MKERHIFVWPALLLAAGILVGCGGDGLPVESTVVSTAEPGDPALSYLQIANGTDATSDICHVYSEPSYLGGLGEDKIDAPIAPGEYVTLEDDECNIDYDVEVVYCDDTVSDMVDYYRPCGVTQRLTFHNE